MGLLILQPLWPLVSVVKMIESPWSGIGPARRNPANPARSGRKQRQRARACAVGRRCPAFLYSSHVSARRSTYAEGSIGRISRFPLLRASHWLLGELGCSSPTSPKAACRGPRLFTPTSPKTACRGPRLGDFSTAFSSRSGVEVAKVQARSRRCATLPFTSFSQSFTMALFLGDLR